MIKLAITLQIISLLYHQITTLFDFFPFNGVRFYSRREKLADAISGLIVMAIAPIGFIFHVPFLMELGLVCYCIGIGGWVATWLIPYFFGPSAKWLEIYSKVHRQTITVLPRRGSNPVANLEHLILLILALLTTAATWIAYHSSQGEFSRRVWVACLIGGVMVIGMIFQCCIVGRKKSNEPSA